MQSDFDPEGYLQNASFEAPQTPDAFLPHYGISLLRPMNIDRLTPNQFIGHFNPRDEQGRNKVNLTFYPAFTLMVFTGGTAPIPFERMPTYTDEPPENVGRHVFDGKPETNLRHTITRNPQECASVALTVFREMGFIELRSVIGMNRADPIAELKAVRVLLEILLPVRDPEEFPPTTRLRGGMEFTGPFLDQIMEYVKTKSLPRLLALNTKNEAMIETGKALHKELLAGLINARSIADRTLNESEAEIRNPDGVKRQYDIPDLETDNADVPADLYLLAHTNRTEIENKPIEASAEIGRQIVGSLETALKSMAAPGTAVLTQAEVDLQKEELENEIAELRKQLEKKGK